MNTLPLTAFGAPRASAARGAPLTPSAAGGLTFADLLRRAGEGGMDSGRPVTLARGVGANLNEEQLSRVGVALDRAEAAGAAMALVLVDGQALTVDVLRREVTAAEPAEPGRVLTGIDAVVTAPAPARDDPPALPPPTTHANPSLARLLRGRPAPGEPRQT